MASNLIDLQNELETLLADYSTFNNTLIEVQPLPTAVQFAKQVSKGYPAIYRAYEKSRHATGVFHTWIDPGLVESAAFTWERDDLLQLVTEKVEVAVHSL